MLMFPLKSTVLHRDLGRQVAGLFSAGEPGAWYDPSDMSTLFQDAAGATPVTAVEQPVGLMLDKSGRGNHATQVTATKRPVYSRRVNMFTESEFRNGVADAPSRANITAAALSGYAGAIQFPGGGVTAYGYKVSAAQPNTAYTLSVVVEMDDGLPPVFNGVFAGTALNSFALLIFNAPHDYTKTTVEHMGGNRYRCSYTSTTPGTISGSAGLVQYSVQTRGFKVTAYDLRLAIDAHLPYQWVNTATDYDADPAKFPAYLRFDGVDDALQTGNIDFTSTDKMTVWAGITKLSDGAQGALLELGPNVSVSAGSFFLFAPISVSGCYNFNSKGTLAGSAQGQPFLAPRSDILVGIGDISGDIAQLRVNGFVDATSTTDQGAGTYGNYPLYIGARNNSAMFFNGRDYGKVIRGAQSSPQQLAVVNDYLKQQMRLP